MRATVLFLLTSVFFPIAACLLPPRVEQDRLATNAQVERVRRERLLLSEQQMEKLGRYEAHLSRELYKALHELEALQARRRGQPAPLARLDITGLPGG